MVCLTLKGGPGACLKPNIEPTETTRVILNSASLKHDQISDHTNNSAKP